MRPTPSNFSHEGNLAVPPLASRRRGRRKRRRRRRRRREKAMNRVVERWLESMDGILRMVLIVPLMLKIFVLVIIRLMVEV